MNILVNPKTQEKEKILDDPSGVVGSVILEMKKLANASVTLEEWSEYAGVCKYRLTDWFRTLTGIPPMTFHGAEKLEIAKVLLTLEELSVTETCFEIGFDSLGSFTSKFTTQVGISPGQYKRTMLRGSFLDMLIQSLQYIRSTDLPHSGSTQIKFDRPHLTDGIGIVAATFKRPIPSGYPDTWRFIRAMSKGTTFPPGAGRFCMAGSIPLLPTRSELINFRPKLVGKADLQACSGRLVVQMNRPRIFDPPITLAVPALISGISK